MPDGKKCGICRLIKQNADIFEASYKDDKIHGLQQHWGYSREKGGETDNRFTIFYFNYGSEEKYTKFRIDWTKAGGSNIEALNLSLD